MSATEVLEWLDEAGICIPGGEPAEVRVEILRIAQAVRARGCRTIGLAPAGDDVGIPSFALHLGDALAQVTGRPTGIVDALGTWFHRARIDPLTTPGLRSFVTLTERLSLVVPAAEMGRTARDLATVLDEATLFGHVVVDLTGLDHRGEHLDAVAILDGTALVAYAGRTTTPEIDRWMRELPKDRNLGLVLLGG